MMHYMKRCTHCKTVYAYQASGYGCHDPLNDDEYCPDCKKVIVDALKDVPKKFDSTWVETNEVTYDFLKEERRKKEEEYEKRDVNGNFIKLPITRRVYASLFNTKTGEAEKNDAFDIGEKQYLVQYWPSKPDDIKIQVLKEKNLLTGEIVDYWRDYR